jgi:hypothetical protein
MTYEDFDLGESTSEPAYTKLTPESVRETAHEACSAARPASRDRRTCLAPRKTISWTTMPLRAVRWPDSRFSPSGPAAKESMVMDGASLSKHLHGRGINIRYLGHLASTIDSFAAGPDGEKRESGHLTALKG